MDPLGESINIQQRKSEFTAPRVQKIIVEDGYEDNDDTVDDIQDEYKEPEDKKAIIPLDDNNEGVGGGAVPN